MFRKICGRLVCCAVVSLSFISELSAVELLTYGEASAKVREDGSDYRIAEINRRISKRDSCAAASWIPSMRVQSSFVSGSEMFTFSDNVPDFAKDVVGGWKWDKHSSIGVSASLSVGAANFISFISGDIGAKLADFTYDQTVSALDRAVFSAYWGLSASEAALDMGDKALVCAEETLADTKAKYDAGMVSSLTMTNADLAAQNALRQKIELQKTRDDVYYVLKEMLGMDSDFVTEEMPEPVYVDLPDVDTLYSRYISTNSHLKQLNLAYKAAKTGYDAVAWGTRLPTFVFDFSYNYKDGLAGINLDGTTYNANDAMKFSISAALPLDGFIPGTSAWNNIKDAKDGKEKAKIGLDGGYREYRDKISVYKTSLSSLETAYAASVRQCSLAEESYELTKESYGAGKASMTDFSSALVTMLSAETAKISANLAYQNAVYEAASFFGVPYGQFVKEYRRN